MAGVELESKEWTLVLGRSGQCQVLLDEDQGTPEICMSVIEGLSRLGVYSHGASTSSVLFSSTSIVL